MSICENLWESMKIDEDQRKSVSTKINENLWKSMEISENLWKSHIRENSRYIQTKRKDIFAGRTRIMDHI